MKNFIKEFKEFAVKGNVMDLAVGVIIGTAFNKIVTSLVTDLVLPPIAYLLKGLNFSNLFVALGEGEYATFAEAQKAGVPTINYGLFIDSVINFLITAFAIFIVIHYVNRMRRRREEGKEEEPTTKPCPYCYSVIPIKATRCPNCTSEMKA